MIRRNLMRWVTAVALLAAVPSLAACEHGIDPDGNGNSTAAAAATVCAKDARPVGLPHGYPNVAALPEGYVVTGIEQRSGSRTVVFAVSPKPFKDTLTDLQKTFSANGWTLSQGEVEAKDAESNFSGNQMSGRWAIRAIDACADSTTVSLVTAPKT